MTALTPNSKLRSSATKSPPLQVEELTPAICREYRAELEHAHGAMRTLVHPELCAPGRGKSAEELISERHGQGLDPYLPDFVLKKIKKAVRKSAKSADQKKGGAKVKAVEDVKAVASHFDDRPNALLACQDPVCRFAGRPEAFLDARDYPHFPEDAFDCPCCGRSTVFEITTPDLVPPRRFVDLRGSSLHDIYKG